MAVSRSCVVFILATFIATATSQESCGGALSGAAVITSPGFPSLYPDNVTCSWSFTPAQGKVVVVQFANISLQPDADFVSVYIGGQLIAKYTGSALPPPLTLTSSAAQVVFTSDSSVSSSGFKLFFISRSLTCGGFLPNGGVISSPNYPALYPNYATCFWTVFAGQGNHVSLHVLAFALEGQNKDSLSIYDGGQNLLGTFSGQLATPFNISLGSVAVLQFRSNNVVQDTGFQIIFESAIDPQPSI